MRSIMQFLSDNAASVHPKVWAAMQAADDADTPYDTDRLSAELDDRFAQVFGREVAVLWVATGTAANCLALSAFVPPHGGVVCHREAHIEMDECGAPGFYLHGAKLLLAEGENAKLNPDTIATVLDAIRADVHQVQPHAVSITQASEYGCCYTPGELAKIDILAGERGLKLHMDGARFANAVAHLGRPAAECAGPADALSFGFVKNGAMNAEAIVFFDPTAADTVRFRRKRAGHLQSKGRFLAAQILAMLDGDTWLHNARKCECCRAGNWRGRGRAPAPSGRGERSVRALHGGGARGAAGAGFRLLRLGGKRRALRGRLGHPRRPCRRARQGNRRIMSWNIDPKPPHALLRPAIAVPFVLVAVIWGSTWLVIKDQLAAAPVSWSVSYRFFIAAAGMFLLAAFLKDRSGFSMTFGGHVMALLIGLTQFFLNFNFVYRAELHLTSGIVAVLFGLLLVPNALLGRMFIGSPVTARFLVGSIVGLAGIALLLKHEAELASLDSSVWLGIAYAFSGILCASIANVLQATETASRRPLLILLAWAMLWGALADATLCMGRRGAAGVPVFAALLERGRLPRADRLGGDLSALFRAHPQARSGPGGLQRSGRAGRRDGALDAVRRLSLVAASPPPARRWRWSACSSRCRAQRTSRQRPEPFAIGRVERPPAEHAPRLAVRHPPVLGIEAARHGRQAGLVERLQGRRLDAEQAAGLLDHRRSGWRADRRRDCRRPAGRVQRRDHAAGNIVDMDPAEDLSGQVDPLRPAAGAPARARCGPGRRFPAGGIPARRGRATAHRPRPARVRRPCPVGALSSTQAPPVSP